jgi:hypothetical protein
VTTDAPTVKQTISHFVAAVSGHESIEERYVQRLFPRYLGATGKQFLEQAVRGRGGETRDAP